MVPTREFAEKIRAASEHRTDPDFVIIARTDARAVTSLDDAIERGNRYAEAGADLIFVEAPQTLDEIRRVAREVKAPLLANMVQGGKTPRVLTDELERLGFRIAIFPAVCMAAAIPAIERALALLKETGTDWHEGPVLAPMDIFRKVGFDWWHAVEEKSPAREPPMTPAPRTLFEKIWSRHVVTEAAGETSSASTSTVSSCTTAPSTRSTASEKAGRVIRRPDAIAATADHYVPTAGDGPPSRTRSPPHGGGDGAPHRRARIPYFPPGDARQGIVHVMGPEQGSHPAGHHAGLRRPHTATHGAFGCLAFGIGSSELEHVLATSCLWQKKPRARCGFAWRAPARPASPPRT